MVPSEVLAQGILRRTLASTDTFTVYFSFLTLAISPFGLVS